jgi:uncharacterized protein (TIGR02145 family)
MISKSKKVFLVGALLSVSGFVGCSGEETVVYTQHEISEIKDGKLIDSRDGNKYTVAKINGSYWMAENLRYVDSTGMGNLRGNSWCHEDDKDCSKFGRLYSWTAAMDFDKRYLSSRMGYTINTQGVCPSGWHIPSQIEWNNLVDYLKKQNKDEGSGTSLKSTETWEKSDSANAPTNRFGFNALAAGRRNNDGETFLSSGRIAFFWSSTEKDDGTAYGWQLRNDVNELQEGNFYKDHGLSIRCIAGLNDVKITGDLDSSYLEKIPHNYGSLEYEGETYRTIKISGQEWMADNLNYKVEGSHCYNGSLDNCKEYGRLYSFEDAKNVCPEGWRLPTSEDFSLLINYAQTNASLRSISGWTSKASKGLNFWGFDAKPAGGKEKDDYFDLKTSAYFWIDAEDSKGNASAVWINYYDYAPRTAEYSTSNEFSVRCVKK